MTLVLLALQAAGQVGQAVNASANAAPDTAEAVTLSVTASDPAGAGRLGRGEALFLRVSYRSAADLRLQARGFLEGRDVTAGAAYNPAPLYPAGEGEALVWVSFGEAAKIDEVRISVYDAAWQPLRSLSYPADLRWEAITPSWRQRPAWATRMNDAQQQRLRDQAQLARARDGQSEGGRLLFKLLQWSIPLYLLLQAICWYRYSGAWRMAAVAPAGGIGLCVVIGMLSGSSFWPLVLMFLSPLAILYFFALFVARLLTLPPEFPA